MIDLDTYVPTKEELDDLNWWKSNSPEETTHYLPETDFASAAWVKKIGEYYCYSYSKDQSWVSWKGGYRCESDFIEKPKEYKGMKGSDKVMVELTGYQVAKLYAVMGHTNGPDRSNSWFKFQEVLGDSIQEIHNKHFRGKKYEDVRNYANYREEWESVILEPETPVLTEAQKKALELKETIAKAQKQLEELEKNL